MKVVGQRNIDRVDPGIGEQGIVRRVHIGDFELFRERLRARHVAGGYGRDRHLWRGTDARNEQARNVRGAEDAETQRSVCLLGH